MCFVSQIFSELCGRRQCQQNGDMTDATKTAEMERRAQWDDPKITHKLLARSKHRHIKKTDEDEKVKNLAVASLTLSRTPSKFCL